MKPEDFILNTDYLSIATKSTSISGAHFDSIVLARNGSQANTVTINAPDCGDTVPSYQISLDGQTFTPGPALNYVPITGVVAEISVTRLSPTALCITQFAKNTTTAIKLVPDVTVFVRESLLTAPGVL